MLQLPCNWRSYWWTEWWSVFMCSLFSQVGKLVFVIFYQVFFSFLKFILFSLKRNKFCYRICLIFEKESQEIYHANFKHFFHNTVDLSCWFKINLATKKRHQVLIQYLFKIWIFCHIDTLHNEGKLYFWLAD